MPKNLAELAQRGKDHILMVRLLEEATKKQAARLALQIEHSWSYSRSNTATETKDGTINAPGGLATTLNLTAISTNDDVNKMLKQSVIEGKKVEFWDIDLSSYDESTKKCKAVYAQGSLESWEIPKPVADYINISTTANIDGTPQEGEVTLDPTQVDQILYAFRDITAYTEA